MDLSNLLTSGFGEMLAFVDFLRTHAESFQKVAGGSPAPRGRFPYICSIRRRGDREHVCGGTLIKSRWVITAAHCLENKYAGSSPKVHCGIYERDERNSSKEFAAHRTFIHPQWNGHYLDGYDIALIKLDRMSDSPLPDLDTQGSVHVSGNRLSALGWGRNSSGSFTELLQIADSLPFVDNRNCNSEDYWGGQITDSMICAGIGEQDTTRGDSGGPIIKPDLVEGCYRHGDASSDLLLGITAFGYSSSEGFRPGVYTRIAYFRDWIDCIIEERDDCFVTAPSLEPSGSSQEELPVSEVSADSLEPSAESPMEEEPCDELSIEDLLDISLPGKFKQTCAVESVRAVIKEDDADSVEEILSEGLNPNTKFAVSSFDSNWTLLHEAARYDAVKSARVLIDYGADTERTNRRRYRPLHTAAQYNSVGVAKVLISSGTSLETQHGIFAQPVHTAAYYDSKDVVEILIDSGADVESRNIFSATPLHLAAEGNALSVAKLLLRKGADIESQNFRNETPLHLAARYNATEVVKFLIDAGADFSSKDSEGDSPLHHAARWGSLGAAEVLVESDADVGAKNSIGQTPLHYAATFNRLDVAKFLIRSGASKKKKDEDGDSPFDEICASASCSDEQVAKLKKLLRS